MERNIVHLDMDTFFVSVERLQNSSLNGKPVIVGGGSDRGVVSGCSYEARTYGVHSAMPMKMARYLCNDAVIIKGDMELYSPIDLPEDIKAEDNYDYIFEPTKEYIVQELIPRSLKIQFYEAILESLAAEHGARMTAMHKATDNATTLIKDLQLTYNKARQAAITNEILEIVGGAEALNS